MRRVRVTIFPLAAGLLFIALALAQSPAPPSNDPTLREQGRQMFASKCAKCHDEDASKKLTDGTTLLTRLAASKDPKARLATRLNSMSLQDRQGVALYMDDLMARFRSSSQAAKPNNR